MSRYLAGLLSLLGVAGLAGGLLAGNPRLAVLGGELLVGAALVADLWGLRSRIPGLASPNRRLSAAAWAWLALVAALPFLAETPLATAARPIGRAIQTIGVTTTGLVPEPADVGPGGYVHGTWSGLPVPESGALLLMAPQGSPPSAWISHSLMPPTPEGSRELLVPLDTPPGQYELRVLHLGRLVAITDAFTVHPVSIAVAPAALAAGESLSVTVSGLDQVPHDGTLLLVPVGDALAAPPPAYTIGGLTDGSLAITLPRSTPPGTYELRLAGRGSHVAASPRFEVTPESGETPAERS